jgi:PAS domain S-box-containing protein
MPVYVTSADGRLQLANTAFTEVLRCKNAIGRHLSDVFPQDLSVRLLEQNRQIIESGKPIINDEEIPVDGAPRLFHTVRFPLREANGTISAVGGFAIDIHQRRKAELELAARSQVLDSVLNSLTEGVVVAVQNAPMILNPAARRFLQIGSSELLKVEAIPLTPETLHEPESLFQVDRSTPYPLEDRPLMRALRGETVQDAELYIKNATMPQGAMLSVSAAPLRDGSGQIFGGVAVFRDVTDRWNLEAQLRQSTKMEAIGRLAGGVAHDFNNLLLVIRGYAELMEHKVEPNSPLHKSVSQILSASQRAAEVTHQLLAFGRKQILQPRVIDLTAIVVESINLLQRLIGEDIVLRTEFASQLDPVKADPGQIHQVMMNLVVNARDAMPGGGVLTIETHNMTLSAEQVRMYPGMRAGCYVMLSIRDTGHGMTRDVAQHIFEPFFTTKEKGKGAGLGLATVYGIVKQSEGFVFAESEPNKGTLFKLFFPRSSKEVSRPSNASRMTRLPQIGGAETLLLVEDDPHVRQLVYEILAEQGYNLLQAGNGVEALSISRTFSGHIDLLLTDVIMPGMSGRQLSDILCLERPGLRVLFTSGYTDDAIVHHGILEKSVNFLQKPYAPVALTDKVRKVLDHAKK